MATVFFKINERQAEEVETLMEEEGYTSKAEFFRFLIKYFKYQKTSSQSKFEHAASELASVLRTLNTKGTVRSSLDDQLKDV